MQPLPHPPSTPRYDPDEIEEEQRERERRNQINRQFNQFVKRVHQDIWEREFRCVPPPGHAHARDEQREAVGGGGAPCCSGVPAFCLSATAHPLQRPQP